MVEVRGEGDNDAHVKVAIGPTVESVADARNQRVVYGRMTLESSSCEILTVL